MMSFKPGFLTSLLALWLPVLAQAETLTIQVGYGSGGSYDEAARLIADHISRHLPGTTEVVVENVPGAGSVKLAKMVMASEVTDGSQIATVSSALALLPIFDPESTDFDPTKVHYLVSMTNSASYCITPNAAGIDSLDAFLTQDFKVGATGKDSTTYTYPAAIKNALGAKFEIVTGFESAAEIDLAMERGEIGARCGIGLTTLSKGDMMERYNVVAELAPTPKNELPDVEFLLDRAPDEPTRKALELVMSSGTVHLPFIAPPATSDEALARLRAAFEGLAADPEFAAAAERQGFELIMTSGAEVETMIDGFLASDPKVQEAARVLVQ
jgi:tripartite-type tricarboxylate transporter receptor subunit TctC